MAYNNTIWFRALTAYSRAVVNATVQPDILQRKSKHKQEAASHAPSLYREETSFAIVLSLGKSTAAPAHCNCDVLPGSWLESAEQAVAGIPS